MRLKRWLRWFRALKRNPIYRREAGEIGEPNPFYDNLNDYSMYVIGGAMLLGLCAGGSNRIPLMGISDELILAWILLCVPGMIVSMMTIYATVMVPAITAPSINIERTRGSWELLRLTPQPASTIVLAKLFGGLSRLNMWGVLAFINAGQILILIFVGVLTQETAFLWISMLIGLTAVVRPWLEIIFAAFWSMYMGLWIDSSTGALVSSYAGIFAFRIVNSTILWLGLLTFVGVGNDYSVNISASGPLLVYATAIPLMAALIFKKAESYV